LMMVGNKNPLPTISRSEVQRSFTARVKYILTYNDESRVLIQ